MKPLTPLSSFLGINITQTARGLFLNQPHYIQELLHIAGITNSKLVQTPVTVKTASPNASTDLFSQPIHYRRLTGSLQYLTITRPDIAYAVNLICQHMHAPTIHHFCLLQRILCYLQATPTHGLSILPVSLTLTAYSDTDWAGDADTRQSTSGFCIYFGSNLVSWKVHKQKIVARSSTEVEYRALAAATTDVIWLRRLLCEIGHPQLEPTAPFCDNTSVIAIASNPIFHALTKHVEIDFHFIQDHVTNNALTLHHLATQDQSADIFTKPHSTSQFQFRRSKLTVKLFDVEFDRG